MTQLARWHRWLLAALWLAVQAACWRYYHAPRLYGDGLVYLRYATDVVRTGQLPSGHYARYTGYPLFLSAFLRLGWGLTGVALGQVVLAGLATAAFYGAARQLAGGRWPWVALATLVLLGWVEVQAFNAFILTESLFTSLLLLAAWALGQAAAAPRRVGRWGLGLALLLALAVVRPNGFIGLAATGAAGLVVAWRRGGRGRWVAAGVALALLPLAWGVLNQLVATFKLMETYRLGNIISEYPAGRAVVPAGLWLPAHTVAPLVRLLSFAAHNPLYFGKLMVLKLAYFLGWPKPWYSALHRAWLALVLPPTYWLAGRGLLGQRGHGQRELAGPGQLGVRVFLGVAIGLQALIVALTLDDWAGRFSGPLVPYWLLLAVLGATRTSPTAAAQTFAKGAELLAPGEHVA